MKKLLVAIGVVIALVVLLVLALPFLLPVGAYKGRLIALVDQATGRELRIAGPMRLSFVPRLQLEADQVSLTNPAGASVPDLLQLKTLRLQLKLLPLLLHGAVEIDRLVMVEPVIDLEVSKAGRPNWVFTTLAGPAAAPAAGAAAPPAAAPAAGADSRLSSLSLNHVELSGGKISYLDQQTGAARELDDIAMTVSLPNLESPASVAGSAVWNGQKIALSLALAKPAALLTGTQSPLSLKLVAAPVTAAFSGAISGVPPRDFHGTLDVTAPSLRALAQWTGTPLTGSGSGFGPLAIKGDVVAAGPKITFSQASFALDDIKATGSLAVDDSGLRPALQAQLAVDKLDLNPYLPPETPAPAAPASGGAAGPAAAPSPGAATFDPASLKLVDADLNLSAGALLYRKIAVGNTALTVHLKDGRLDAQLSRMVLYGGTGKGTVVLDGSGPQPRVDLTLDLAKIQIAPLLEAAADLDRLSGTGSLRLAISGLGNTGPALVRSLAGKGSLSLADGALKGVDLLNLARTAAKSLPVGNLGNVTQFSSLTASYTISKGVLHNPDLRLAAAVPISGAGTIDLASRMVDYRVTPELGGALRVPILVTGPWDRLNYRPDLTGILQDNLRNPGRVLKSLKSGGINAGGLLKGLLGR